MTNENIENWFKDFTDMMNPQAAKEEVVLEAIWCMNNPIFTKHTYDGSTRESKSVRITEGDLVIVEDGKLATTKTKDFTHKIIGCYGTIDSSKLYVNIIDLNSLELSKVEL